MAVFSEFLMITGAWTFFLFVLAGIVNWLSQGFFSAWLRTRMSQGKRWLVKVWGADNKVYYASGKPDGTIVRWKDRNKQWRRTSVTSRALYRSFGVDLFETDESNNAVRELEDTVLSEDDVPGRAWEVVGRFVGVPGYDAVKFDNLIERALTLPRTGDKKAQWMFILVLLTFLGMLLALFWLYQTHEAVRALQVVVPGAVI